MKKILLYGNWKMNLNVAATKQFAAQTSELLAANPELRNGTDFCIFPPFILIPEAVKDLTPIGISVGSQNASEYKAGAYTGEVAPSMIREAGAKYSIVGHSERRHIYGETSEQVNRKAINCLANGLTPVICVGETLEERDAGKTLDVVNEQLIKGVKDLPENSYIIAYEPVWAIGTGRAASAADAEAVCAYIKTLVKAPVLYGGSVKPSNSAELFAQPSIDGGLIGGASMKPADYIAILANYRAAEAKA